MSTIPNDSQIAPEIPRKLKSTVYIDGFNWYFSIFKHKPAWKWLNLQSLFEEIRPDEEIVGIRFFTAMVDPKVPNSAARGRQALYHLALRTLPKVKIIQGSFRDREVRCGAKCQESYLTREEKKTDVNIAVTMIDDVISGFTESVVLVSGDSDQEPAVMWIKKRYPNIKLTVYIPSLPEDQGKRQNRFYGQNDITCKFLTLDYMTRHQLPNQVEHSNGQLINRPSTWR